MNTTLVPAGHRPTDPRSWWDRQLEAYGSIRAIAVLRMALGVVVLAHLRPFLADARTGVAYDDHFWAPYASWLPHVPASVWVVALWAGAVAALFMAVGLWTRLATVTAFVAVATNLLVSSTHFRHNRTFLAILLFGLALLPCGRVLSVDAWRRRRRGRPLPEIVALWPLLLLRAQVALVYLASGISKLVDPDWFGGVVLWDRVVRYRHVLDPTPLPAGAIDVLTSRWLYYGVAPVAVFTELFIGIGLWFPRTRIVALWVAVVFHLSIEVSAAVEVFSLAALAALALWVTPSTRDRIVRLDSSRTGHGLALALRAGDWFGRFRIERVGGAQAEAVTVIDRDGSSRKGPAAVVFVLSRLPLTFALAAPLLLLAGRPARRAVVRSA